MKKNDNEEYTNIIYDGKGVILGRLASHVAKMLLKGYNIVVVNANKLALSGNHRFLKEFYQHRFERGDRHKGPFYPKQPNMIFKRAVRGMLPKNKRGREVVKNLMVYNEVPEIFSGKAQKPEIKTVADLRCRYVELKSVVHKNYD